MKERPCRPKVVSYVVSRVPLMPIRVNRTVITTRKHSTQKKRRPAGRELVPHRFRASGRTTLDRVTTRPTGIIAAVFSQCVPSLAFTAQTPTTPATPLQWAWATIHQSTPALLGEPTQTTPASVPRVPPTPAEQPLRHGFRPHEYSPLCSPNQSPRVQPLVQPQHPDCHNYRQHHAVLTCQRPTHNPLVLGSSPSGPTCLTRVCVDPARQCFGRFMSVSCPSPISGGLVDLGERGDKQVVDWFL